VTAIPEIAELARERAAVSELQEWLRVALARIETLEGALDAARRREAEARLVYVLDRPRPGRPKITKPLRPRTDRQWSEELRGAGLTR
jgi:hypothetical protein